MEVSDGHKALNFSDFQVSSTPDDDTSVLLSNTNKLLSAVGITTKKIASTDELSRVASSLFVAVYESLFHQKIIGVVRNPRSKEDYENNAQLVIDSLSDQIQLDLKHITGSSIVSGDLRVLSNLVHILVRIVSLTSQESLTSYDSVDLSQDGDRDRRLYGTHYRDFLRVSSENPGDNDSLSSRESQDHHEAAHHPYPYYLADAMRLRNKIEAPVSNHNNDHEESPFGTQNGMVFNEDLRRSISRVDKLVRIEGKMQAARKRRQENLSLREAASRASNVRHAEASRAALERRWADDVERDRKAFALRRCSSDQLQLRKIYKGLLQRVVRWKVDEHKEERAKVAHEKEKVVWQIESLQNLFDERMAVLRSSSTGVSTRTSPIKEEIAVAGNLLRTVEAKNRALLKKERERLEHERDCALLRRREAHENLLAVLAVEGWQDSLRKGAN